MSELSENAKEMAGADIMVRALPMRGMLSIRAEFDMPKTGAKTGAALATALGLSVPKPNASTTMGAHKDARSLLWMSPDEMLLICPLAEVAALREAAEDALSRLPQPHFLVADVSDARVAFGLEGPDARDVLAKLTPADLRPEVLATGHLRRTRLAQVPAAIWLASPDRIEVLCFRSVENYVAGLLAVSSQAKARVGHLHGLRA